MKTHYDSLGVPATATSDDIKRAFRYEIARYHPDKVQHLGREFQDLAATHASELTVAYTLLMDEQSRTAYDLYLKDAAADGAAAAAPRAPERPQPAVPDRPAATAVVDEPPPHLPAMKADRLPQDDFLRKASLERLRDRMTVEFPDPTTLRSSDFDLAVGIRPNRSLFKKFDPSVTLFARFVDRLDETTIESNWAVAARVTGMPGAAKCVLLLSPMLAPPGELANAISRLRRKHRNSQVVIVPIDVRDWSSLIPADTPVAVKGLLERLRGA